jgi:photosystem II stability/assembly factor-like uncharacterized protein
MKKLNLIVSYCFIFLIIVSFSNGCKKDDNPITPGTNTDGVSTLIYSSDMGLTWTVYKLYLTDAIKRIATFNQLANSSVICSGTKGTIIRSTDGGSNWAFDSSAVTKNDLNDMSSVGTNLSGVAVGNSGTIIKTDNDGVNWVTITSPTTNNLYSVRFIAIPGIGFAVGSNGTVITSTDRGNSWSLLSSFQSSFVTYRKIELLNPLNFLFAGDSSNVNRPFIIKTSDGGTTWQSAVIPSLQGVKLFGMDFRGLDTGIAVGSNGTIIKTVDGGLNWTLKQSGLNEDIKAILFNMEICIAVGNKHTLLSFDNGDTWSFQLINNANGPFHCIFRIDQGEYFVAGD